MGTSYEGDVGKNEEIPGEEAFPAYLASRIAAFYERAGVIETSLGKQGSLTIGGAVSPAGGSFEEPVTQATLAVVGAFLGLSRERSDARRYPAIDPLISWTKYLSKVGKILEDRCFDWGEEGKATNQLLYDSDQIAKRMEVVGEEGTAIEDLETYLKGELYEICYLQQNAFDKEDCFSSLERQIELLLLCKRYSQLCFFLRPMMIVEVLFTIAKSDQNMNFYPFHSEEYFTAKEKVTEFLNQAKKRG